MEILSKARYYYFKINPNDLKLTGKIIDF